MPKNINILWFCECGNLNEDSLKVMPEKVKCTKCNKEFKLDDLFLKGKKITTEEFFDDKGNCLKVVKEEFFYRTQPLTF